MDKNTYVDIDLCTNLFAEIAILLLGNGANSNRTKRNVNRIASAFNYHVEIFFSYSAVIITATHILSQERRTIVKVIPHYGVNFTIVSDISILSWQVVDQQLSVEDIFIEIGDIKKASSYNDITKMLLTGLAIGSLSKIFEGDTRQFLIAFFATVAGFFIRQLLIKRKYNINISWLVASFTSVTIVNIFRSFGIEVNAALSACVLWLIPGVPLINGFLDVLEGYMLSGAAKLMLGLILMFMIAVGFYVSLFLFGYEFRV